MTDYLPEVYQQFSRRFPAVKEAFDSLGAAEHDEKGIFRGGEPLISWFKDPAGKVLSVLQQD